MSHGHAVPDKPVPVMWVHINGTPALINTADFDASLHVPQAALEEDGAPSGDSGGDSKKKPGKGKGAK